MNHSGFGLLRHAIWAGCALVLSACGGGGSDAGDTTPYALAQGVRNLYTGNHSWTVSGTASDGLVYRMTWGYAASGTGVFPVTGVTAARSLASYRSYQGSTLLSDSSGSLYYRDGDLGLVGVSNDDGTCSDATTTVAVPTTARIGSRMTNYASVDELAGCTAISAVEARTKHGWSLTSDRGVSLLCQDSEFFDTSGISQGTQSDCVGISPDGTLNSYARSTAVVYSTSGTWTWTGRNY